MFMAAAVGALMLVGALNGTSPWNLEHPAPDGIRATAMVASADPLNVAGRTVANTPAGTPTKVTRNSPVRKCFRLGCAPVDVVTVDQDMTWTHFANNQKGNRWYHVVYDKTTGNRTDRISGWIFCKNVTAGC